MTSDEIMFDAEERMEKAISVFADQLRGLRTGRATPALVDNLRVEYYGSPTPLKTLAQINCPDPQSIVIRPFDASCLKDIEKAIRSKALQHFVLVVTPAALASPDVRREIRLARQEGKAVSPVKGPGLAELGNLPRLAWTGF